MYTNEDKLKMFKNELEDIQDEPLREFAKNVILSAPDYIFTCPASSTGKYHPTLSLGEGGLVRHTRLVAWFARNVGNAMMVDERNKDFLTVAALAHDMRKHGDGSTKFTVKEHPKLAADLIEETWNNKEHLEGMTYGDVEKLKSLVMSHMGQWGAEDEMPLPNTKLEQILHTADYLASRKEINDFIFRPTEDVTKIEVPVEEYRITFGKHSGKTLGQFYNENKDEAINYFEWVVGNDEFKIVEAKEKMKKFLEEKTCKNARKQQTT